MFNTILHLLFLSLLRLPTHYFLYSFNPFHSFETMSQNNPPPNHCTRIRLAIHIYGMVHNGPITIPLYAMAILRYVFATVPQSVSPIHTAKAFDSDANWSKFQSSTCTSRHCGTGQFSLFALAFIPRHSLCYIFSRSNPSLTQR